MPDNEEPRVTASPAIAAGEMTPAQRLGQRLRQARLRHNMTQSEVAQKTFSVSYISAVERGQIRPSLGALERLSERLEVPLADLMRDADAPVNYSYTPSYRETQAERQREDTEQRLRMAPLLARQGPEEAQRALDSLLEITSRQLSQQDQITLHARLAFCYFQLGRGDESRREAQEGMALAERAGDMETRERLRNELGNAYHLMRNHHLALDQYRACRDAIDQGVVRDPRFHLTVLFNLGNTYWRLGDATSAIEYLRQAKKIAEETRNPEQLGAIYYTLSAAYAQGPQNDPALSRLYASRSMMAYEDADNERVTSRVYNRLGRACAQDGQIDEAVSYLEESHALATQQGDARGAAEAQRSLASIFVQQGKLDDAARLVAAAAEEATISGDPIAQGETLLVQAQVAEARKKSSEAEQAYEQAITLLQQTDATQYQSDALFQYSSFLERQGQNARALELLKQAWSLRDRSAM